MRCSRVCAFEFGKRDSHTTVNSNLVEFSEAVKSARGFAMSAEFDMSFVAKSMPSWLLE